MNYYEMAALIAAVGYSAPRLFALLAPLPGRVRRRAAGVIRYLRHRKDPAPPPGGLLGENQRLVKETIALRAKLAAYENPEKGGGGVA